MDDDAVMSYEAGVPISVVALEYGMNVPESTIVIIPIGKSGKVFNLDKLQNTKKVSKVRNCCNLCQLK